MSPETNRAVFERYLDAFDALIDPDYVNHNRHGRTRHTGPPA